MTNAIKIILSSVLLALFCTGVSAQIRIIVPFAVGGAFDQMARNFGKYIETSTGETVIIENATGAGSVVGTQKLLTSNPNNTVLFTNNSHFMNIIRGRFEEKQFRAVSMIGETPYVLLGSKTKSLTCADLRNPEKKFFLGTAGKDSASSSAAALIIKKHNHFTEVPYRGVSAALTDVLADRIDITFSTGNVHKRPDTHTIANTSKNKFNELISWKECLGIPENFIVEYLVVANADAGTDFTNRINKLAFMFAKDTKTVEYFKDLGITDITRDPVETDKRVKESLTGWKQIYRDM
jgi:tripartite-type tricarboxylate transporter receptor subunit TctC